MRGERRLTTNEHNVVGRVNEGSRVGSAVREDALALARASGAGHGRRQKQGLAILLCSIENSRIKYIGR